MQRRYYNLVSTHEATKTLYIELIPENMNGNVMQMTLVVQKLGAVMCINLQPCTYVHVCGYSQNTRKTTRTFSDTSSIPGVL